MSEWSAAAHVRGIQERADVPDGDAELRLKHVILRDVVHDEHRLSSGSTASTTFRRSLQYTPSMMRHESRKKRLEMSLRLVSMWSKTQLAYCE